MPSNDRDWANILAAGAAIGNSWNTNTFTIKKPKDAPEPVPSAPGQPRFRLKCPGTGIHATNTSAYESECIRMDEVLSANPETKLNYLNAMAKVTELLSGWRVHDVDSGVHHTNHFDTRLLEYAPIYAMGLHAESAYYAIANTEPFDSALAKAAWVKLLFLAYDVLVLNCELRAQSIQDKTGWSKCIVSQDYYGQATWDKEKSKLGLLKKIVKVYWNDTLSEITGNYLLDAVDGLQLREPVNVYSSRPVGQARRAYTRSTSEPMIEVDVAYGWPTMPPYEQSARTTTAPSYAGEDQSPPAVPSFPDAFHESRPQIRPIDIAELIGASSGMPRPVFVPAMVIGSDAYQYGSRLADNRHIETTYIHLRGDLAPGRLSRFIEMAATTNGNTSAWTLTDRSKKVIVQFSRSVVDGSWICEINLQPGPVLLYRDFVSVAVSRILDQCEQEVADEGF